MVAVALQRSLFGDADQVGLRSLAGIARTPLSGGAWIDVLPEWLTGSDAVFDRLAANVTWRAERRPMYDRIVEVPRLVSFYDEDDPLPEPILDDARSVLCAHYAAELGEPFRTAGLCFYRDGRDSVAWHGDRVGRGRIEDTMVAILSVGARRELLLRPSTACVAERNGRGASIRFTLGHGDLLVMGGSCQRTWEHAVPKRSKPVGPRISIQFRPRGVR